MDEPEGGCCIRLVLLGGRSGHGRLRGRNCRRNRRSRHSGVITAIGEAIADDLAGSVGTNALGTNLPGIALPAFGAAIFDEVLVTPECLTMNGLVPIFVPFSSGTPSLQLDGSVTTSSTKELSSGTYHYPGLVLFCDAKDFPYTEKARNQTATYQATPSLLGLPLSFFSGR